MRQSKNKDLKVDLRKTKLIREKMASSKKIKITINIDEDTLAELHRISRETGVPYQPLLNRLLKETVFQKKDEENRIKRLEKEVAEIKKKLSA